MLNRFKNKLANIVNGMSNYPSKDSEGFTSHTGTSDVSPFPYSRPAFLQLTPEEVQVSADHISRPILVPRNGKMLPWCAGYAEVINAGKTKVNEDQARAEVWTLPQRSAGSGDDGTITKDHEDTEAETEQSKIEGMPVHYFGIFDGHAGTGASLMAVNILHLIIQDKLSEVQNLLDAQIYGGGLTDLRGSGSPSSSPLDSPTTPPFSPPPVPTTASMDNPGTDGANVNPFQSVDPANQNSIATASTEDKPSEDQMLTDTVTQNKPEGISEGSAPDTQPQEMDTTPTEPAEATAPAEPPRPPPVPTTRSPPVSPTKAPVSRQASRQGFSLSLDKFNVDNLIVGALESAFFDMDAVICRERRVYKVPGGCTSLVALFFGNKLYIANAGDSRAVLCANNQVVPVSKDFTPETDRTRIQLMAWHHPELLCNMFCPIQFAHRITRRDIGKRVLHRDGWRRGWSYKTVVEEDVKMPLIYGEGKKARLLATIGVSRGFGDHDLRVYESDVYVKPFMTCAPEVRMYDFTDRCHTENDVLIMATDGLWDVTPNEKAGSIVQTCLAQFSPDDPNRYTSAAQELVMHARGILKGGWRTSEDRLASGDDITAYVIPLHHHGNADTDIALSSDSTSSAQ